MTLELEIGKTIEEAFSGALLLTGSIEASERAVTDAIAALGPYPLPAELLEETARSAIQRRPEFSKQPDALSMLPLELQAVAALPPTGRDCFVMRILMGLSTDVCSGILKLPGRTVEEALHSALLELPVAVESVRFAGGPR